MNKRRKVGLSLVVGVAAVAFIVWSQWRTTPTDSGDPFPLPGFSTSPYLNTRPDARYVGIATCKECHSGNYQSYLHTTHSRALSDLDPKTEPPDGAFTHPASGRSYRTYRSGTQFRQEETLLTPEGKLIARFDFPIRYLVGSGHFTRSYLAEADGFLLESPITWYTQRKDWGISPGYDVPSHPGFTRPATAECLVCHVGRLEQKDEFSHRVTITEQPIGCESCHGPGSRHVEYHRSTRNHPRGTDDLTIVNPARLSRARLEAICAVCHQQGAASVYVRGRGINDFRPGMPLSDYRMDFVYRSASEQMSVVGHFEQLRRSACYQKSEELSCLTCHHPHQRSRPTNLVAYYRQKCMSCHETMGCKLELTERLKREPADNCSACHMPRGKTEIPHVAFTHHRIGKHAAFSQAEPGDIPDLVPLEESPHLTAVDRNRNLGLAYLMAASRATDSGPIGVYQEKARTLLEGVYELGLRDGATVTGLATIQWRLQNYPLASEFAREALARKDLSAEDHINALQILFEAHLNDQETASAIAVLEKLTQARLFAEDWRVLGECQLRLNRYDEALRAFKKALTLQPFRPQIHEGLARTYRHLGEVEQAAEHEEKARLLARYTRR